MASLEELAQTLEVFHNQQTKMAAEVQHLTQENRLLRASQPVGFDLVVQYVGCRGTPGVFCGVAL